MKLEITCRNCSLSDIFKKMPKNFKCPYCGNDTYYKREVNEKV